MGAGHYGWKGRSYTPDSVRYAEKFFSEMNNHITLTNGTRGKMTVKKAHDNLKNNTYKGRTIDPETGKEIEYEFSGKDADFLGDENCTLRVHP